MTIYFMGGEMGAFVPADSNAIEVTSGGFHSSSFSRCALDGTGATGVATYHQGTFTALASGYIHFRVGVDDYAAGTTTIADFMTSAGAAGIRLRRNWTANTLILQYWNGSAFVEVGNITISMTPTGQDIDIAFTVNSASASISLYVGGTERITGTGLAMSGTASIGMIRAYGAQFGASWSQFIVADEATVGWRLGTIYMSGAGASTTWNGTVADIDEAVYSDADTINSTSNNEVELFTGTAVFNSTGYRIKAVAVTARAKKSTSGPTQMALALRSSSTIFLSTTHAFSGVGYEAHQHIWETNPATTAAFHSSELADLQFGVKSLSSTST